MLGAHGVDKGDVDFWALHPGGHRIVEVNRYMGLHCQKGHAAAVAPSSIVHRPLWHVVVGCGAGVDVGAGVLCM